MNLHEYLALPDAPSVREFCKKLRPMPNEATARHWRGWYENDRPTWARRPNPARCVEFVRMDKRMSLQALRPEDWFRIWPTLDGAAKARAEARRAEEAVQS